MCIGIKLRAFVTGVYAFRPGLLLADVLMSEVRGLPQVYMR